MNATMEGASNLARVSLEMGNLPMASFGTVAGVGAVIAGLGCFFWHCSLRRRSGSREAALRASEERYRVLIEQAPEAILVFDSQQGRFVQANRNAERLFGCPREQLLQSGPLQFYSPQQPDGRPPEESYQENLARVLAGETLTFERVIQPLQGDPILCQVSIIRLPPGGPLHRLSYIDITARKRAEEELRKHRDHLEELVRERTAELAEANQALAQQASQLRALAHQLMDAEQRERHRIAHVLHENFQQFLVAAKYSLQLFRNKGYPDAAAKAMESLDQAIEVSRSLTVELRPPVLHELGLGAALEWLEQQTRDKYGLAVSLWVAEGAEPACEHLRLFLFEAIRELLLNVAKHAQVDAAEVYLKRVGDQIQVLVADQGVGFDPGQPAETSFGLFSIRERVRSLGGCIEIDSTPGRGSRVTITVPLNQST